MYPANVRVSHLGCVGLPSIPIILLLSSSWTTSIRLSSFSFSIILANMQSLAIDYNNYKIL